MNKISHIGAIKQNQISDITINSTLNRPGTNRGHLRIHSQTASNTD